MEKFVELVRALGDEMGLQVTWQPVSPIEFVVDGLTLVISLDRRSDADAVVLYCELGEVPTEREIEVYRILLEANMMWSGTGDATLAVNSATRQALLCYRLPTTGVEGPAFIGVVAAFATLARSWRDFIAAAHEEIATPKVPQRQGMIVG